MGLMLVGRYRCGAAFRRIFKFCLTVPGLRRVFSRVGRVICFYVGLMGAIPVAYAASGIADQATIVNVQATTSANLLGQPGVVFVYLNVAPGGPSCATYGQSHNRFVVNPNTAAGNAIIATLLSAQAQGKNVQITGTGACDLWGDTESIQSVFTE